MFQRTKMASQLRQKFRMKSKIKETRKNRYRLFLYSISYFFFLFGGCCGPTKGTAITNDLSAVARLHRLSLFIFFFPFPPSRGTFVAGEKKKFLFIYIHQWIFVCGEKCKNCYWLSHCVHRFSIDSCVPDVLKFYCERTNRRVEVVQLALRSLTSQLQNLKISGLGDQYFGRRKFSFEINFGLIVSQFQ